MLNESVSLFPPAWQPIIWAGFGLALVAAAGIAFYRRLNSPMTAVPSKSPIDMTALGIAFANDRAQQEMAEAVKEIAQTIKKIEAIYDRSCERDIDWRRDMLDGLNEIAQAKKGR